MVECFPLLVVLVQINFDFFIIYLKKDFSLGDEGCGFFFIILLWLHGISAE